MAAKLRDAAYIINVQGDEPLIEPGLINSFVQKLRADRNCEMITAAHPFDNLADANSPHQVKVVIDLNGNALYFSRAPIPYSRLPSRICGIKEFTDFGAKHSCAL